MSSRPNSTRLAADAGSTLIEILIAIVVLGVGMAALVGGLIASISASNIHRSVANGDTILRSYAEQMKFGIEGTTTTIPGGSWCAAPTSTIISGYTVSQVPDPCPPTVPGVAQFQTVTLTISSAGGSETESMQVVVRQP